jgi:ssRNA-specific RNase YbeY (16S rRNA maturation enzyme)
VYSAHTRYSLITAAIVAVAATLLLLLLLLMSHCRNYASRLYKEHTNTARFSADAPQMTKLKFSLKHYAGEVVYSVETFCDKNKVTSHYFCRHLDMLYVHAL